MYLRPGTILHNRYQVETVLGHGGFGITYKALDLVHQLPVAIKEYLPGRTATRMEGQTWVTVYTGAAREEFLYGLQKFLEEAQSLARFADHPHIVSALGYFEGNGTAYMVMEYVEGMTLKQFLEQQGGRITFEQAKNLILPVMDALEAIHQVGLLHRDISPENLYITRDGEVKLLDFGAARVSSGEWSCSLSVILKTGYAPEEQYRSNGRQGPWTDVYALAATMYRAVTGRTPPDALDRKEADTLIPPSHLGVDLTPGEERALLLALSVEAPKRFQNIRAFREALLAETTLGRSYRPASAPAPPPPAPSPPLVSTSPRSFRQAALPLPAGRAGLGQSPSQLAALVLVPLAMFALLLGLAYSWHAGRQAPVVRQVKEDSPKVSVAVVPKASPDLSIPDKPLVIPETHKASPEVQATPTMVPEEKPLEEAPPVQATLPPPRKSFRGSITEMGDTLQIVVTNPGEGPAATGLLVLTTPGGKNYSKYLLLEQAGESQVIFPRDFGAPREELVPGRYEWRLLIDGKIVLSEVFIKKGKEMQEDIQEVKKQLQLEEITKHPFEYIGPPRWPWTSRRLVTQKDIEHLSDTEITIMYTEILAKHGMVFISQSELDNYYRKQPWYSPKFQHIDKTSNPNKVKELMAKIEARLNLVEKKNIEFLLRQKTKKKNPTAMPAKGRSDAQYSSREG
jgi:serine/threonine protein kinase